jgi:hypothetical protein
VINDSGRLRGGGGRSTEDEPPNPGDTRRAFHSLMCAVAEYIAAQPSPNLMRATASRIAQAVIATGDDLSKGGTNRWEGP